jgi:hypothetical protein
VYPFLVPQERSAPHDPGNVRSRIAYVMGTDACTSSEVFARLAPRGWIPRSEKPKEYVAYILSHHPELYELAPRRGILRTYRVKAGVDIAHEDEPHIIRVRPTAWELLDKLGD